MSDNRLQYWKALALLLVVLVVMAMPVAGQGLRSLSGIVAVTAYPVEIRYQSEDGIMTQRPGVTGAAIFLDDTVLTGPDAGAQLLLADGTTLTLGPDSRLKIDRFVYDPDQQADNSLVVTFFGGAFKYVSGQLGEINPDAIRLNLPTGVIAIRGTAIAGQLDQDGSAEIVLLDGEAVISGIGETEDTAVLTASGWGVRLDGSGGLAAPYRLAPERIDNLLATLTPASDQSAGSLVTDDSNADTDAGTRQEDATALTAAAITDKLLVGIRHRDDGSISAEALISALGNDSRALEYALRQGIDPRYLDPDHNLGVELDRILVGIALSGAQPLWAGKLANGGIGNPPVSADAAQIRGDSQLLAAFGFADASAVPPQIAANFSSLVYTDYSGLVAAEYTGSARFSRHNLPLVAPSAITGSGFADYDLVLDYRNATATGRFAIHDAVINSTVYADAETAILGFINADTGLAYVSGEFFSNIQLGQLELAADSGGGTATAYLIGGIGSITDGTQLVDGKLGLFTIRVMEDAAPDNYITATRMQIGSPP